MKRMESGVREYAAVKHTSMDLLYIIAVRGMDDTKTCAMETVSAVAECRTIACDSLTSAKSASPPAYGLPERLR